MAKMKIKLSDHFTYGKLLRFTFPSVVMMVFTSLYSVVDGLFVANLVGDLALSAVNIIFPVAMIIGAFGFMLGTGGSAIVARTLGEKKKELADRYFSMFILCVAILGAALSVVCVILVEPISRLAGASDLLIGDCVIYGRILLAGSVPFMLQTSFQSFLVVAEKPHVGLMSSIASGLTNIVLDYVFIALFDMGIAGAGLATVLGYCVGGLLPVACFLRGGEKELRLVPTALYPKALWDACINGSSELMSNISASVVGILYNIQLMRLVGEMGVAAYSVMMYVDFIFIAVFLGYSIGCAPVVSYHFGAGDSVELKGICRRNLMMIGITSAAMVAVSELASAPLAAAFVGFDAELYKMTVHGFRLFALCYIFCGLNIYASAFFTALCNGAVSAFISFMRSFLLRGGMVLVMPLIFGIDGIWSAVVAAEGIGAVISVTLLLAKRKSYGY